MTESVPDDAITGAAAPLPAAPAALPVPEAAAYIGVEPGTLDQWRSRERRLGHPIGPRYCQLGRKIVYRLEALDEYLREHEVAS